MLNELKTLKEIRFIEISKTDIIELEVSKEPPIFKFLEFSCNSVVTSINTPILYIDRQNNRVFIGFLEEEYNREYLEKRLKLELPPDYDSELYDIIRIFGTQKYIFIKYSRANEVLRIENISIPRIA